MSGYECPVLLMHEARPALESWRWMERGFLPQSGGWQDQEAWWAEAIEAMTPGIAAAAETLRAPKEAAGGGE